MTTLALQTELAANPADVWAVAGNFGGLAEWHPWVPNCTLSDDGLTRTIHMGAMSAIEVLDPTATTDSSHSYTVSQSPMPVENYRCTWRVTGGAGKTTLSIKATFDPKGVPEEQAVAMLQGFFDTAFQVLGARFP